MTGRVGIENQPDSLKHNHTIEIDARIVSQVLGKMARNRKLDVPGFRVGKAPAELIWRQHPAETKHELINFIRNHKPAELDKLLEGASTIPEYQPLGFSPNGNFELAVSYYPVPEPPVPDTTFHAQGGNPGRAELQQPIPGPAPSVSAYLPPAAQVQMRNSGLQLGGPSGISRLQGGEPHATGSRAFDSITPRVELPAPEQRVNEQQVIKPPQVSKGVESPMISKPASGTVPAGDPSVEEDSRQQGTSAAARLPSAKSPATPQVIKQLDEVRNSAASQQ